MTRSAVLLALLALVGAACAADPGGTDLADGGRTVDEVTAEASPVAPPEPASDEDGDGTAVAAGAAAVEALWWSAPTVADGAEFVAADLAGEDVVLWMWAPWCTVCNREAPDVARALAELPDDVTVVGVAGRDEVGPMRDFIAEHGLGDITHVVDEDGSVWASYGVSYQPAWVFIDGGGSASVAAGALGYDGLLDAVAEVLDG